MREVFSIILFCFIAIATSASADILVSTNTTAQRFSTLTMEEKLSYLDGVMDTLSIDHAVNGREWVCPNQSKAVYLLMTEKAISTYSIAEGPSALRKPAAFYAFVAQQASGCQAQPGGATGK